MRKRQNQLLFIIILKIESFFDKVLPLFMVKRNTYIIIAFLMLILPCHGEDAFASTELIVLDGLHKFSLDDKPVYSSPDYDDSQWLSIKIPGSWQSQNIKPAKDIGWYRIRFSAPDNLKNLMPAILLGRIGDVDEVFLNGVKIGSEGLIAEIFVEATKVERLYRIPDDLLRYDATNVLAIRVMNTYLNGGIFDEGTTIGDYNALLIEKLKRTHYAQLMEFCFFTFFSIFFVTCFFFYIKGLRDKEYIFFWLFISIYGILFVLESVTFFNTGLKTPFIQQIINALATILPAMLVLLLSTVYREKLSVSIKLFLSAFPLLALLITFFPDYTPRLFLIKLWKIFFVIAAVFIVLQAVKAYFKKFHESGPIMLGILGLIIGTILESVGGLDLLQITGFFLWDYSAIFFMICVMYALSARYTRIQKELRIASVKIFDAHEEERKRVARELHDGIGQSLLSLKLRLKMFDTMAQKINNEDKKEIRELIADTSSIISELKAVAMDLRPSFLENAELSEAVKWHAGRVQEKSGIPIHMQITDSVKVSPKLKDNIYRIFQEALSNVVQHSGASSVDIILCIKGNNVILEVKDNGTGFQSIQEQDGEKGLGLYTIKERVELLGGAMRINSSVQNGTCLSIEVPLE
jgi:signal transduction histidine kinase